MIYPILKLCRLGLQAGYNSMIFHTFKCEGNVWAVVVAQLAEGSLLDNIGPWFESSQ